MRIKKMRWLASCLSVCLLVGGVAGCGNERKPAEQGARQKLGLLQILPEIR